VGEHIARAVGLLEVRLVLQTTAKNAGPKHVVHCHPYEDRSGKSESFGSVSWSYQVCSPYSRLNETDEIDSDIEREWAICINM